MASGDEQIERAYQPPTPDAGLSASPAGSTSLDPRLVWLHLVVLAVALALLAVSTTSMQIELFEPGAASTREAYAFVLLRHGLATPTLLMPVLLGLLPLLVLPCGTATQPRSARWLTYVGLVAWSIDVFSCLAVLELRVLPPLGILLYAAPLATVAYASSLVLSVVGGGGAGLGRMPVVSWGLVGSGVGAALAGVLGAYDTALSLDGATTTSVPPPEVMLIVLPVVLATAVVLIEARGHASISSRGLRAALAVMLIGMWGRYAAQVALGPEAEVGLALVDMLMVPVLLFALVRLGRSLVRSSPDAVSTAVLLALAATGGMGLTWKFRAALSADVHLHDTYFAVVPLHFAGGAVMLLLAAACFHWAPTLFGRTPRRFTGLAGVVTLGGGMLVSFAAMAVLGQQGMPRRYFTYVPQFESLHQCVGVGGLIASMGIVMICLALVTGRRVAAAAQPEGSAGV